MRGRALVPGVVGLVAAVLWLVGALLFPGGAALGWLVAWCTSADLLLGALGLVLLAHVAPIRWFTPLRPAMTGIAALLALLAVLFVPVIAGMEALYPWAGPPPHLTEHEMEMLEEKKRLWFDPIAWTARSVVVLITWAALAWVLRRLESRADDDAILGARRIAAVGLVILGITWTVAAIDWWMSLDPVWFSAILGIQRFSGSMAAGVSLAVLVARLLERSDALPPLPPDVYHALGRLMLTFVILWTYTTYDQLMLQWIAGLPHEIRYWIPRLETAWIGLLWTLGLGHFVLPFALLLSRPFKRNPRALSALALWLLVMRLADEIFAIVPDHPEAGVAALVLGALALVAHAGLLIAGALALNRGPVPREALHFGLEYRSP